MIEKYVVYYDEVMELWNVKEELSGICYPMTSENMAKEICSLLNHYDKRLKEVLNELYVKDRKLEDLDYDLDDI